MSSTSENIASQTQSSYEDYNKLKTLVDLGYFLDDYIVSGGVTVKDVTYNNKVNVSEIVASLSNDVTRRAATSFTTTVASATYYLDYKSSGDFSWDTAHYSGTYLPIAQVTTDANKNVLVVTDMRGTVGGVRFKYDVTAGGNSLTGISASIGQISEKGKAVSLYSRAVSASSIVPSGSLDHIKNAIANKKAATIVIVGDSISTTTADQLNENDSYAKRLEAEIRTALPNVTITFLNYAIGGTGISALNNPAYVGGTNFTTSWSTVGKSWIDSVRDAHPDLVINAFGMNDAGAGEENTSNNLSTLYNTLQTFIPKPSMAVVTTMLPVLNYPGFPDATQGTLRVARVTREWGKANGVAVVDASRLWRILRDGLDDVTRAASNELNWEGYTTQWGGDTSSFNLSGSTLTPLGGASNKFISRSRSFYNGLIEVAATFNATGINNAAWINYREHAVFGKLTVLVVPGNSTDGFVQLYYSDSSTALAVSSAVTIATGIPHSIQIVVEGIHHKVYVDNALLIDYTTYKKMHDGGISMGSSGPVPTYANMKLSYLDPLQGTPVYTELEMMGTPASTDSGNGQNHPSGLGYAMSYMPAFNGLVRELTLQKESNMFLPSWIGNSEWAAASGITTTAAGEKLWYKAYSDPNLYDRDKGIALRRVDLHSYYTLSTVVHDLSEVASLGVGEFAYFRSGATDYLFISANSAITITWDSELYKYR